jgi:CHAD domain-containing protein
MMAEEPMAEQHHPLETTSLPTLCDAVRRLLALRRDAVLERLEDVAKGRGDREEAVHELRVSTRRGDAALEFCLPWLPEKKTARLRSKLAKLRKATGRVRDCDVLKKLIREAPLKHRHALKAGLKVERKRAERRLGKVTGQLRRKARHARQWNNVLEAVAWNSPSDILVEPPFLPWAGEQFGLWLSDFASDMAGAIRSFETLHAFRLSGKRLRYALELLPEEHQRQAAEALMAFLKELQDRIGAICDQEALRRAIEDQAVNAKKKVAARLETDEDATSQREDSLFRALQNDWPELEGRLAGLAQQLKG